MDSLEEMCLSVIVRNFEVFHFAFTASDDKTLEKSFEFLQRRYSLCLILKLFESVKLKDQYMTFLMNKHLEYLCCSWLIGNIYKMEEILCHLPNVKEIIACGYCTDEILKSIAKFCPKVVEIRMIYSSVSNIGLKYLCKDEEGIVPCPELSSLFIKGSLVTDEGVEYLISNLPSLKKIDYENVPEILYSLNRERLPELEGVQKYNLIELDLINSVLDNTDLLKISLTVCPKLTSLVCTVTDEKQLYFFNNSNLENLHLNLLQMTPKINVSDFLKKNGFNITTLKLSNGSMFMSDLSSSCPKLIKLSTKNVSFLDDNTWNQSFLNLQKCTFQSYDNEFSANSFITFVMSSSPKLKSVSFKDFNLTSNVKISILKCMNRQSLKLKNIHFYNTSVDMCFIKDILKNCPYLKTLYLRHCSLRIQEINELKRFAQQKLPYEPSIRYELDANYFELSNLSPNDIDFLQEVLYFNASDWSDDDED